MKEFENAKYEYENITIPNELSERVNHAIRKGETTMKKTTQKTNYAAIGKWSAAIAAVLAITFIVGLNVSPVFAKEMKNVPIIGDLAKVLTFREYEVNTEDYVITVEIPTIEMISEDFSDLEESVNAEIYALCEQYAEESRQNALDYREAFLETGGTLEEWKDHDIQINVSYTVLQQTDEYLSLLVKRTESWNSASAESETFNIDLQSGEQVSLDEVAEATDTTYYEDNFTVPAEAAGQQAEKIKEAVADKDIEALADLTAFPVYVGLDEGIVVETSDDFIALGAEQVFTDELIASVTNADTSDLMPSKAGFFLSADDTSPSITFGVVDGQLKISGINY